MREVLAVGGSVGPTSTIVTVAGGGSPPSGVGDGGPAAQASLYAPAGVALDGAGNLYVADRYNFRVREVLATGGSIGATSPITTVAGTGTEGYNGDGIPAVSASLVDPTGVAVDAAGTLYIADYAVHRVRGVLATGGSIGATSLITTVAGIGNIGYNGDNIPAATAQLTNPWGVATDGAGNLYIVDTYGQRVREVGGVGPVSVATTTMAPTSSTRYDGDGHAVSTTDANGHTATTAYDPLGRAVVQTNPVSGTSIMTYTATELTQQQDPRGNVTTYSYDQAGRQTLVTEPVTGTVQYQYDAVGNTAAITSVDTSGNLLQKETRVYDALNRVGSDSVVSGTTTLTTLMAYTRDGQAAVIQQPNGDTTNINHDLVDETLSVTLTSNGTSTTEATYGYDAAGNQATSTDADGRTVTTSYDPDNRPVQSVATGGGTTTVTTMTGYDPDNSIVSQTTQTTDSAHPGQVQTATWAATYDAGDQQATETDDGLTTVYGYDAQGQQRVATVQDGQTAIATARDAEGRVTSISEGAGNAGPYVSSFTYNANDQLQTVALPGGVQESVQYDPNSQLIGVTALGPNTGGTFTYLTSHYGYTYDAANRVNSTTTLSGTDSLTYDGASRLASETQQTGHQIIATGGKYGWTYDGNGNIQTAIDDTGATDVYTYSTTIRDELTQMGATDNPVTKTNAYSYDGRGDVTGIANTAPANDKNALSQHLSYDSQGRVNQVTYLDHGNGNTTTTITIAYNADGQRSDYTYTPWGQPPLDTQFQYRNGQLAEQRVISDTTANGPVVIYTNTYLYGPQGKPLELLHAQPGQTVARYWYILDGQGSVVALTDANGSVVDRYAYDSWGESTSDDRTNEHVPQQLRYKAQYYDEKLTWYWLDGRYYDPETERFLQPDANRGYADAADDPLDHSGRVPARPTQYPRPPFYHEHFNILSVLGFLKAPAVPPTYGPIRGKTNFGSGFVGVGTSVVAGLRQNNYTPGTSGASSTIPRFPPLVRGHLLAKVLSGSNNNPANFVPLYRRANDPGMKPYELYVRDLIKNDDLVLYDVIARFADGGVSNIPRYIEIAADSFDEGGVIFHVCIQNTASAPVTDAYYNIFGGCP